MTKDINQARWRKASASANNGGCVEIGDLGSHVGIRDTKHRESGHLTVSRGAFAAFIAGVKSGKIR